jgi:hypothetical protein
MNIEKRVEEKKQELLKSVKDKVANYVSEADEFSKILIDYFCTIKPPKIYNHFDSCPVIPENDDRPVLHNVILKGPIRRGRSLKPGNIRLNWKKLLLDGSEAILTIVGVVAIPWLILLAGLIIWNKVYSLLNIEIEERHAGVIWTMWKNKDKDNCIGNDVILDLVNKELQKYDRPTMNQEELDGILTDLNRMRCIKKEDNKWWLHEWVDIEYQ